jgi:hypothetical protein
MLLKSVNAAHLQRASRTRLTPWSRRCKNALWVRRGGSCKGCGMREQSRVPEVVLGMKDDRPYFSARGVTDELGVRYVAWLDLMGTSSMMRRSATIAATFIGKLHSAAIKATKNVPEDQVRLYPVIDGVYITSAAQAPLLRVLKPILKALAVNFVLEKDIVHRFMVRGAIAYGPTCEGKDLLTKENWQLNSRPEYAKSICLGVPLAQAFDAEKAAAPYGIWIHESARSFSPPGIHPLTGTHWHWWRYQMGQHDEILVQCLHSQLLDYLDWCKRHSTYLIYDEVRIEHHRQLVDQYFTTMQDDPFLADDDPESGEFESSIPEDGANLHETDGEVVCEPVAGVDSPPSETTRRESLGSV